MLFYVLFVCECVLYYCHRVLIQMQLTNIYRIISYHIIKQSYTTQTSQGLHQTMTLREIPISTVYYEKRKQQINVLCEYNGDFQTYKWYI